MVVAVDELGHILDYSWRMICEVCGVPVRPIDIKALFEGVDLSRPHDASVMVLANMLPEVMEMVDRFSRWL